MNGQREEERERKVDIFNLTRKGAEYNEEHHDIRAGRIQMARISPMSKIKRDRWSAMTAKNVSNSAMEDSTTSARPPADRQNTGECNAHPVYYLAPLKVFRFDFRFLEADRGRTALLYSNLTL